MKTTPLHAQHVALNAKMGEFAGYDMPLYYDLGVLKEHEWVRSSADAKNGTPTILPIAVRNLIMPEGLQLSYFLLRC